MWNVYVPVDDSSLTSWTRLFGQLGGLQEHELRGDWEFIQYHSETDIGTFLRNSECETASEFISAWTRSVKSNDQAIKCLLRFSSVCGTDEWKQRSNNKMEKSSGRIQDVSSLQRIIRTRWRSSWIRVEYFPRIFVIAGFSRDPTGFEKKEHRTWRVHGPDHLHVNVQRHRLVKKKREMMIFVFLKCRKSQGLRDEILARTLDVSGSWIGKKLYGTLPCTPEGKWDSGSPSIQEHWCLESWHSEKEEWQRHHTLQCGCFAHRSLVPNYSFCKSSQFLRSSYELALELMQSLHRARLVCVSTDSSKSDGCHCKTTSLCRTSSRRSISSHPSENGGCSKIAQNSKVRMSIVWIRLPRHRCPTSWSITEDPVVPLERHLYIHLLGLLWERQTRGSFIGTWMGKKYQMGMFVCPSKTWTTLIGIRGWHENGWKEATYGSRVENWWKMLILMNQQHFLAT